MHLLPQWNWQARNTWNTLIMALSSHAKLKCSAYFGNILALLKQYAFWAELKNYGSLILPQVHEKLVTLDDYGELKSNKYRRQFFLYVDMSKF